MKRFSRVIVVLVIVSLLLAACGGGGGGTGGGDTPTPTPVADKCGPGYFTGVDGRCYRSDQPLIQKGSPADKGTNAVEGTAADQTGSGVSPQASQP